MGNETILNNGQADNPETRFGYPVYSDGKLLTSDDLNRSFNYLHSHIKYTRKLLFGQGIVSGLSYSYNKDTGIITIKPGIAITKQGSIIEITEEKTCTAYESEEKTNPEEEEKTYIECVWVDKKESDGENLADEESDNETTEDNKAEDEDIEGKKAIELTDEEAAEETDEEAIEVIDEDTDNSLKDLLLGLKLIYNKKEEKHCSDSSCTTKSNEINVEIIPFLTKKPDKDTNITAEEQISPIQAPVFKNIVNYNILPFFLRKVTNHFYEKIDVITKALEKINNIKFNELLITYDSKETSKYELGGEEGVIDEVKKLAFDNQNIPAYLSFTDDLIDAINEFINFYNLFLSKYRISETLLLDEAVILGKLEDIAESRETLKDVYRDFNRINDEKILERMFLRIKYMIIHFTGKEDNTLKLQASSEKLRLGEKVMPSYYKKDLEHYWDAHNEQHIESETNVFLLDFKKADLYKLNGYNNKNIKKDLTNKIYLDNLPLLVVKQEMAGYDLSFFLEDYRAKDTATHDLKSIAKPITLILKETILDNSEIAEKIDKILGLYEKYDIEKAAEVLGEITKESIIEEIWQHFYILIQDKKKTGEELNKHEKQTIAFILITILYHRERKNKKGYKFTPHNTLGINYVGGAEKKDVLLLITHHNKTLLCLSMPYFLYDPKSNFYKTIEIKGEEDLKNDFLPEYVPREYPDSSSEEIPDDDYSGNFDIYMLRYGRNKEHTANYLRESKKITFRRSKEMVNSLPILIFENKTQNEAQRIAFVLNERLKANVLIVPAREGANDQDKLADFLPDNFHIKVSLFEEDNQITMERLKELTKFKTIISDKESESKVIWMKNIKKEDFLNVLEPLKQVDAIFKFVSIE